MDEEQKPHGDTGARSVLPILADLTFDPPLEFQQAYRLGPRHQDGTSRPCPVIACLLRHGQARQLLTAARAHGPFRAEGYEIHITADYSKETNERRKAFLALRPRMRQLEVKYGLFEPARLWVTKNGVSNDFYEPEDLRLFLDSLQPQTMGTSTLAWPRRPPNEVHHPHHPTKEGQIDVNQTTISEAET
ncbi:hypothetical protein NDU88_004878 [Pleurodeles waltl]|uniref:Uncharacterized protein n=1 Tax=Pleurodeles waltl TaxID=8319 RepID=A0AAV7V484_PLEWA|nr:hypothetical protein NDU88_004878 [Pleurodeles waltl]